MPEISRFFGIVIQMYYNDHNVITTTVPHIFTCAMVRRAIVAIESLQVIGGWLSPRVLSLVTEWATQHRLELSANWELARNEDQLRPVAPLE
jgi:hypothetical protein